MSETTSTYQTVSIRKGRGGWGAGLTLTPTDEKKIVLSVTGGGIHPVAQRIAELSGAEREVDGDGQGLWTLVLQDGSQVRARAVVNAAGAWARPVAQWLGIDLPVFGKRRTVFHFTCPEALPGCPLLSTSLR